MRRLACLLVVALCACGDDNPTDDNNCVGSDCDSGGDPGGDTDADPDVDTDGDGVLDSSDCAPSDAAHWSDCSTCVDVDGDDYGTGCDRGADCDDTVSTGATCHTGCSSFVRDQDGDGRHEALGESFTFCTQPAQGYVAPSAASDCDDGSNLHWDDCGNCQDADGDGRGIGCNINAECDDDPDTGASCFINCLHVYFDQDGDGYGIGTYQTRCVLPDGYAPLGGDCDDSLETGSACHTACPAFYVDIDGDNHGDDDVATVSRCALVDGLADVGDDCAPDNPRHWNDCLTCLTDADDDGHAPGCDGGATDCNINNPNVWTSCGSCRDYDHDGAYVGCDDYRTVEGPDCDDHDPMMHPSAVDFPDSGVFEDCASPEPHAAGGSGIYVDVNGIYCGTVEDGSQLYPFCSLAAALAASTPLQSVFVAQGVYALTGQVTNERIYGGYTLGWVRSSDASTTIIDAPPFNSGAALENTLVQGATLRQTLDQDIVNAVSIDTNSFLADVIVTQTNTQTECFGVFVGSGDVVLVRTSIQGAGCNRHYPLWVNDGRKAIVWASTLQAGIPANSTQDPNAVWSIGNVIIGESTVISEGDSASGINGLLTGDVDVFASKVTVTGAFAFGITMSDGDLRLENGLVRATAQQIARSVILNGGNAHIINNNLFATAVVQSARGVLSISNGFMRAANNIVVVSAGSEQTAFSFTITAPQVALYNNVVSTSGGAGAWCPLAPNGGGCVPFADGSVNACSWTGCEAASGNLEGPCGVDAEGAFANGASICIDAGLDASNIIAYPIDFQGQHRPIDVPAVGTALWDIGRDEYVP